MKYNLVPACVGFTLLAILNLNGCTSASTHASAVQDTPPVRRPANARPFTSNVMAPLMIGNIFNPDDPGSASAWNDFQNQLNLMKHLGANSVSTDVWWGIIEGRGDGNFDWRYYDKMSTAIANAGLKWVPILSFHQCGGNVGDSCNIPIPSWIWSKYIGRGSVKSANDLKYQSEEDHFNQETVSVWGTPLVVADYQNVMRAFQTHYQGRAGIISEVNISLGPAGELRYPSYNSHDPDAGYPSRGRLQAYSRLARESFRSFMRLKYGAAQAQNASPPDDNSSARAQTFFEQQQQYSQFGKDFFDWYSSSLRTHGQTVLTAAIQTFNAQGSPFRGIPIGAKVPGVHWRMAIDHGAELAAGLISTSAGDLNSDATAHGYRPIISVFRGLQSLSGAPQITMHFTCLEMDDSSGGQDVGSLAKSLVHWVATEAHNQSVPIKGENALGGAVYDNHAWDNINDAVNTAGFEGITVLRMTDLSQSQTGQYRFSQIANSK